ncbi:mechanosensitive ion channel family protein [Patescibacteria group bacterium]|nr:mechanosensitive ion channel family protein [Patescibacteria group bacterium]MBU1016386.1 mechanosensitive ion channel family protein [Patescibacteria group bacterium]MBU1685462.1 mechanosensitive ion channel family protein [Patescibacteria group bacterium]MBU1938733.1 mechanosensitive ion channel family protein [Patescibacteria group bacterium]
MLDSLIPNALAQGITGTASSAAAAGRDVAVGGAQTGIQALFSYVVNNIGNWIGGMVIVVISFILANMAAAAAKKAILKKRDDVQESALILVERMTRALVLTVGITIAFAINGLNFTAVIGALSLGIGFALKDIIGNFISGVIMLAQNRINIGDFIKVKDILGTIVSIDTRATILQAIDGTEVVIPNQIMLGETLISYTTNPFRRIDLGVGVDYKTNLPMVTSLIKAIIDKDEDIAVKPEPLILVDEFGSSSINIMIRFWVESSANWQKIRSNLANRIKKAFDEVGVNIPFPIRTLKLDEDDRSFLKTMDSMKKGIVPEKAKVPGNDQIATAATNTEKAVQIPYSVFEEHDRAGQVVTPEEMKPAAAHPDVAHKIDPAPGHDQQPRVVKSVEAPTPAQTSTAPNEPTVTPPPTHL